MNSNNEVPIEVVSRHGQVSNRMQEYVLKKVERLSRFYDRISRIEIIVDGPHEEPVVEAIVHVEHAATVVAKEQGDHFNGAIDSLVGKLERQLVKAKEKLKQHKGEDGLRDTDPDHSTPENEETYEDVVRKNLGS